MTDPIDPFFHSHSSGESFGAHLYERAFQFYSWLLSRDFQPEGHKKVYKQLSFIMTISKLSFESGHFIKDSEELQACSEFENLVDGFTSGAIKSYDLPNRIDKLLNKFIENNPKSSLANLLLQLEYRAYIESSLSFSSQGLESLKFLIQKALACITKDLNDLHAKTVFRELEKTLAHPENFPDLFEQIKKTLELLF